MYGVRGCSSFWPGEFHGLYNPRGRKESDTTERLSLAHTVQRTAGFPGQMISFPLVDTAVLLIDYNSILLWLLGRKICVSHQKTDRKSVV